MLLFLSVFPNVEYFELNIKSGQGGWGINELMSSQKSISE